jgi:predicted AlkP superfamily phosphohydrolase/phosphomutase
MKESNSKRVFILGLDGATFDIMKPMIDRGKLPTFARIMKEGVHCGLNSTIVSNSAPAWTSFATGKNPGKHSISGFFRLMPNSYQLKLLNGTDNRAKALWEVLGEHGKRSIVMNIPMTYPPKEINGLLISGLDAPSLNCDFTHPRELKDELLRVVPDYKINLHLGGYLHSDKRRRKAIDVMLSCIRAREKAVLYLMKSHAWDLFAVRFNSPDNVQHQFWKFMDERHPLYDPKSPKVLKDAIFTIYDELDRVAASIMSQLPEDCTLMVMSDHGAGPRTNKTIRLNAWLKSLGYLTSKATERRGKAYLYKSMEKCLSTFLKRVPPELKQWIAKVSPNTISRTWTYFRFPNIDWAKTKAFVGETEGIRINLKGKYPNGTVDIEEYEALRDHIIKEAKKLQDPSTGEQIFQHVYKREDIFSGPYVQEFPDIIALTTKDQYNISAKIPQGDGQPSKASFIAEETHWRQVSGSHRREGIFIIKGKDIKQNTQVSVSEIVDVCPTAAHLLELPVPSDMDGRVLAETFSDAFVERNPVRIQQVGAGKAVKASRDQYDDDEKGQLVDHLRGLGYIE